MLDKLGYNKLVLMAFESLKREIKDCEDYTINDYNSILQEEEKKRAAQAKQAPVQPTTPKTTKKEDK